MTRGVVGVATVGVLTLAAVPGALGQDGGPVPLDEITVTAVKQPASLSRAPIAATVITGEVADERGMQDFESIARLVPGASFANTGTRAGNTYFTLRGFRNNDRSLDPAAALYIDGVPFGDFLSQNQRLFDIEQVEVLRGPQGVLYGVNSQAGVVSVTTRAPRMDRISGFVGATLDSHVGSSLAGGLSGPIIKDVLGISIAGTGGWMEGDKVNLVDGQHFTSGKDGALRAKLRLTPTPEWTFDANIYSARAEDDHGYIYAPVNRASYAANGFVRPYAPATWDAAANAGSGELITNTQSLSAHHTGSWFDFNAVAAFRQVKSQAAFDFDLSPTRIFVANQTYRGEEQFYEARLQSPDSRTESPFTWLIGVSHNIRNAHFYRPLDVASGNPFGLPPGRYDSSGVADLTSVNTGLFGQATYRLFDQRLGLTAGIRHEVAERDMNRGAYAWPFGSFPGLVASTRDEQVLTKFAIDFRLADGVMVYSSAAQGWKAGGVSPYAPTVATSFFEKETSWTYEAGVKARLASMLSVAAAAYYNDISGFQDEVRPNLAQVYLGNAERASVRGFEVEATWTPVAAVELKASFGATDATYDDYLYDVTNDFRMDGRRIRQIPDYTYTLSARYDFAPRWWMMGEVVGLGPFMEYNYSAALNDLKAYEIDGTVLLNARAGYKGDGWDASIYVTNITDERYFTNTISGAGLIGYREPLGILGDSRTFGGRVRVVF